MGGEHDVECLKRVLRRGVQGIEREYDAKHAHNLREYGMEGCRVKETLDEGRPERSAPGEVLNGDRNSKLRRGCAIVNYISQGRRDLAVSARVLPQRMANPSEGTECCLKRTIR